MDPEVIVEDDQPHWRLARKGINFLLNNKAKEAEELFLKYPHSIQMYAGYSFAVFMDALMSFEEEKLSLALTTLKEVESRCIADTGWLKTMKSKMFGGNEPQVPLSESLESQIILADSLVCIAILTFLQQDISGYFKAGWVLRKSWKVYQNAYNQIHSLYKMNVGELHLPGEASMTKDMFNEDQGASSETEWDLPFTPSNPNSPPPHNGYIKSTLIPHSKSAHANIYSDPTYCQPKNRAFDAGSSDNLVANEQSNTSSSCDSISNSCDSNSVNVDASFEEASGCSRPAKRRYNSVNKIKRNFAFLKKSASANSGLSRNYDRNQRANGYIFPFGSSFRLSYFTSTFQSLNTENRSQEIDPETLKRLMSAISFGYGLFQLGISLLPPSLFKVTNFLGFGGDRQVGLANLMYARLGEDMRAPLATLSLLWYHTIVRPFYALDGSNVKAGVEASKHLIEESQQEYYDSALFLFFDGRIKRLMSDIPGAILSFQKSLTNATQREVKILSTHEVGWCHLIQLDYSMAEDTFRSLKNSSRWSSSFYAYIETICSGSRDALKDFSSLEETKNLLQHAPKGSQLDDYLARRYILFPSSAEDLAAKSATFWKLLIFELLYLWNALPSCNSQNLQTIAMECETVSRIEDEPMAGLKELITGISYCILGDFEKGEFSFRKCLEVRKNMNPCALDAHISAFSQYELGMVLLRDKQTQDEGMSVLQKVNYYKGYDFEQRLSVRINAILKSN